MATTLRRLRLKRVSLVDMPANEQARVVLYKSAEGIPMDTDKALWTAAFINTLPDASFAYIEPGGEKDDEGKTKPRSLRHLPYKDASGKVDLPHLRNALARLPQTQISAEAKASAEKKLRAAAEAAGVGKEAGMEKQQPTSDQVDMPGMVQCKKCNAPVKKGAMTCPNCGAQMEPDEDDVAKAADGRPKEDDVADEKLKADLDAANAKIEALTKERDELTKRLETPEEIEKRKLEALPDSIRKELTDARERLAKMESEKAETEHVEKARKEMPQIPGKTEDLGKLLKRFKDVAKPEDFDALVVILKAASAQIEKGDLFREKGKPGELDGAESAMATINRLIDEMVTKSGDKMSRDDAQAKVFHEHPDLYTAYARSVTRGATPSDQQD